MLSPQDTWLFETEEGVRVSVRVQPRAKKEGVVGVKGNRLIVRLGAPPVEGAANESLLELFSSIFRLPKTSLRITSGHQSRNKTVFIPKISMAYVEKQILEWMEYLRR